MIIKKHNKLNKKLKTVFYSLISFRVIFIFKDENWTKIAQ